MLKTNNRNSEEDLFVINEKFICENEKSLIQYIGDKESMVQFIKVVLIIGRNIEGVESV